MEYVVEVLAEPRVGLRSVLGVRKLHATPALTWYDRSHDVQYICDNTNALEKVSHARRGCVPEALVHSEQVPVLFTHRDTWVPELADHVLGIIGRSVWRLCHLHGFRIDPWFLRSRLWRLCPTVRRWPRSEPLPRLRLETRDARRSASRTVRRTIPASRATP